MLKQRYMGIIGLIVLLAIAGLWYSSTTKTELQHAKDQTQTNNEAGVTIGKAAPTFSLSAPDGKLVTVGNPGKTYVLNFWASWCPPCRAEMPELVQFIGKYSSQVQFYAINLQESPEKATQFLQQNGYNLPILMDKSGTVAQTFRVTAIPTTIVVDSQGIIRYRKTGGVTLGELEGVVKGL